VIVQVPRSPILDRQAERTVVVLLALGGHRKDVADEEFRDKLFVVVMHLQRAIDPGHCGPRRSLRFDQH